MRRDNIEHLPEAGSLGSEDNPIKCNGIEGEREYLQSLIGINGEPVTYKRVCSMRKKQYKNVYDLYCLRDANDTVIKHLFLDMYHKDADYSAPDGFLFVEDYLSNFDFISLDFFKQFNGLSKEHMSIRAFLRELGKLLAFKEGYSRYRNYPSIKERYNIIDLSNFLWITEIENLCKSIIYELKGLFIDKPLEVESIDLLIQLLENIRYKIDDNHLHVPGENTFIISPLNSDFSLKLYVNIANNL